MKYQSGLQGVEFYAFHGVYEEERVIGGKYIVDLIVTVNDANTFDDLNKLINYETLYHIAKKEMANATPLIETVAHRIIQSVREQIKPCDAITVRITKSRAGGLIHSGNAVIELTWQRE